MKTQRKKRFRGRGIRKRPTSPEVEVAPDEQPLRIHAVSGNGYLVAPCLVLWAAALGTREAYEFAMAEMGLAKAADARRYW